MVEILRWYSLPDGRDFSYPLKHSNKSFLYTFDPS